MPTGALQISLFSGAQHVPKDFELTMHKFLSLHGHHHINTYIRFSKSPFHPFQLFYLIS